MFADDGSVNGTRVDIEFFPEDVAETLMAEGFDGALLIATNPLDCSHLHCSNRVGITREPDHRHGNAPG